MISYDNLWKLLIDKKMNKSELITRCNIASNTIAKMGKNEPVSLRALEAICNDLNCKLSDIVEIYPDKLSK